MNQITITQALSGIEMPSWRQQAAGLQAQAGAESAFSMLLLSFLEEEGLPEIPVKEFDPTEEADKKLANEMAMQMVAEMLLQKGFQVPEEMLRQIADAASSTEAATQTTDLLQTLYRQTDAGLIIENPKTGIWEDIEEIDFSKWSLPEEKSGEEPRQTDWQQQSRFQSAVHEAQQKLAAQPMQEKKLDIEALQAAVDSGRFQHSAIVARPTNTSAELPDIREVADQLKAGLDSHLTKGESEFVVRLKPDGLGEITVRLTEKDSRMTLSIVASNPQVAKLINQELPTLQNAMRPLHVEVGEIGSANRADQYQSSNDQNHFFHQQYEQPDGQSSRARGNGGEQQAVSEPSQGEYPQESALNTYI